MTNFFVKLTIFLILILFLIAPIFLPTGSSSEMQAAYFILAVPDSIKKLMLIASVGLLLSVAMELIMHLHKKAILTFFPDTIVIEGKNINIKIPVNTIYKVYSMDLKTLNDELRGKFKIEIKDKQKKITDIRLIDYSSVEDFMNNLIGYKNIDIDFCDFNMVNDFDDEN